MGWCQKFVVLLLPFLAGVALCAAANADDSAVPPRVMLVAGWGGFNLHFDDLKQRLDAEGFPARVVIPEGRGLFTTIRHMAEDLDQRLASIPGITRLDFVTHSMGGLIVLEYLAHRRLTPGIEVRSLISLGAPFHGTNLSNLVWRALPLAAAEMRPDSEFIRHLLGEARFRNFRVFSLWIANDHVVRPPESSVLDGATNILLDSLPPLSHWALPSEKEAVDDVVALLKGQTVGRRGPQRWLPEFAIPRPE